MLGILLAITAALGWGTSSIFARLGVQHIKPATGTFISLVSSATLVVLLSVIMNFDAIVSLSLTALAWFGVIGVISYGIGRQLRFFSIRYIGVAKAAPIFSSSPLFAVILAVAFTGERINLAIAIGTLCIVTGVSLLMTSE